MISREGRWRGSEGRWSERIVEVDVEKQLVLLIGMAFVEPSRDGPVRRTYIALHDIPQHGMHVCDLSELLGGPVVQEFGALLDHQGTHAVFARVLAVVEGAGVEPEPVEGAAEAAALVLG